MTQGIYVVRQYVYVHGRRQNKFHYNYGDYNNDLKILSHKPKPQIHSWFSHINREHPIVFRQKLQDTNFLHFGAHT